MNYEPDDCFKSMIQRVNISCELGRKELYELGKKGPYHRFVNFPVKLDYTLPIDENYTESVTGQEAKVWVTPKECICSSRDLFNFGCKCGFLKGNYGTENN